MANEERKEELRNQALSTDSTIRELQETVNALPRTDHMTLPAIQVTRVDDETRARQQAIVDINNAKSEKTKIGDTGKTLGEIRNEFMYGVSDLSKEGPKHELIVKEGKEGTQSVTIIPPVIKIVNAEGEEKEVQDKKIVIEATLPNIAAVDADAPKNPVEAREAAGLNADGSEGTPQNKVPMPPPSGGDGTAIPAKEGVSNTAVANSLPKPNGDNNPENK
jgi:hypothetical protein